MAKRNNKHVEVGDPEEIDKIIGGEFNPVKSKLAGMTVKQVLESFVEYAASDSRPMDESIDTFLDSMDVDRYPEESKIKKTLPYDRSRIEFMRMQIGPVQQFFMTLGNVLFSMSERLGAIESDVLKIKVKDEMKEEYLSYSQQKGGLVSLEEFKAHWEEKYENKKS